MCDLEIHLCAVCVMRMVVIICGCSIKSEYQQNAYCLHKPSELDFYIRTTQQVTYHTKALKLDMSRSIITKEISVSNIKP